MCIFPPLGDVKPLSNHFEGVRVGAWRGRRAPPRGSGEPCGHGSPANNSHPWIIDVIFFMRYWHEWHEWMNVWA